MESSFADESWGKNYWYEHNILAHINFNQDLSWFYTIYHNLKKNNPDIEEYKAHHAWAFLNKLEYREQKMIWKTLQETIIVILEPKSYIKSTGIEVLQDASFRFRYRGREIIIDRSKKAYSFLNNKLQKYLSTWIIEDSPISKINFAISTLTDYIPQERLFSPENILNLINKKDSKKEVMGTIKLATRLCSAFIDLIDPETTKLIIEQLYEYDEIMPILPEYHQKYLRKAISSNRVFDEGHKLSVNIIKECFDKIDSSLNYYDSNERGEAFQKATVSELDSKNDIRIQACDWASGIARYIYIREGIKGLDSRFKFVIFNGKKI